MRYIGYGILVLGIISLTVWLTVFNWQECKKVGHSTTYCVLHLGK